MQKLNPESQKKFLQIVVNIGAKQRLSSSQNFCVTIIIKIEHIANTCSNFRLKNRVRNPERTQSLNFFNSVHIRLTVVQIGSAIKMKILLLLLLVSIAIASADEPKKLKKGSKYDHVKSTTWEGYKVRTESPIVIAIFGNFHERNFNGKVLNFFHNFHGSV